MSLSGRKLLSRIIKSALWVGGLCFILIFGAVSILYISPSALGGLLQYTANLWLTGLEVHDIKIEGQICGLPDHFTLVNVQSKIEYDNKIFLIHLKSVRLSGIPHLIAGRVGTSLELKGLTLEAQDLHITGLDLQLALAKRHKWNGPLSIKTVTSHDWQATDLTAQILIKNREGIFVDLVAGQAYQGKISGKGWLSFNPGHSYIASLNFGDIDSAGLEKVNPTLFSQLRGKINGVATAEGSAAILQTINLDMRLQDGGEVHARLLAPLLSYLPQSIERQRLKTALDNNRRIPVTLARLSISNLDQEHLPMTIQVESTDLNLDLKATLDIIIEGGLNNLLTQLSQFTQYLKG